MKRDSRRRFLAAAGSLAAASALPLRVSAQMTRMPLNNMPQVIARVVGASKVNQGRVKISLPPLVENGHLVPLSVNVDSPMTPADYVKAIHVFTDKNPLPEVISFYLGPGAGRASFSTRVRLADSENVIAIAQMSDGSFWSQNVFVVVTTAACLEEL
ncbi:MAG: putative sulfur oxidation protein soxY [Betaproteobacteria bacterium]|nr:putative sulfur oxidation protein soxY [Betaproteobacteria bacterium]